MKKSTIARLSRTLTWRLWAIISLGVIFLMTAFLTAGLIWLSMVHYPKSQGYDNNQTLIFLDLSSFIQSNLFQSRSDVPAVDLASFLDIPNAILASNALAKVPEDDCEQVLIRYWQNDRRYELTNLNFLRPESANSDPIAQLKQLSQSVCLRNWRDRATIRNLISGLSLNYYQQLHSGVRPYLIEEASQVLAASMYPRPYLRQAYSSLADMDDRSRDRSARYLWVVTTLLGKVIHDEGITQCDNELLIDFIKSRAALNGIELTGSSDLLGDFKSSEANAISVMQQCGGSNV